MRGNRIELTTDVTALGHTHQAGDRGTVQELHSDGYLTVRMDDGRPQFPHAEETRPTGH